MGNQINQINQENKALNIRYIDENIRNRLKKGGVQYNIKIIIKGRKKTGKTTLWLRLQGNKYYKEYNKTKEIQAATIDWSYKNTYDVVKVEVWDIVDKAIQNIDPDLCGKEIQLNASNTLLDATTVDVYRGTNAVIIMIDPFSIESLTYAREEAHQVPSNIAIMFLLNFRDLVSPNQLSEYYKLSSSSPSSPSSSMNLVSMSNVYELVNEIRSKRGETLIEFHQSSSSSNTYNSFCTVYATDVSLLNCWGLIELDRFFNVPFLLLKKRTLQEQLQIAEAELLNTSLTLTQNQVSWNENGVSKEILEKYHEFNERYYKRIKLSNQTQINDSNSTDISSSYHNSISSNHSTEINSTVSDSNNNIKLKSLQSGIHHDLKQIINETDEMSINQKDLTLPSSNSPTSTLQITKYPSKTTSPSSSSSTPSPRSPSPSDNYSPPKQKEKKKLEKQKQNEEIKNSQEKQQSPKLASDFDLDDFVPSLNVNNSYDLNSFLGDEYQQGEQSQRSSIISCLKTEIKQVKKENDIENENEGIEQQNLVRIKKKKKRFNEINSDSYNNF